MPTMEWRNKITTLIKQTEVNLSRVDGRPVVFSEDDYSFNSSNNLNTSPSPAPSSPPSSSLSYRDDLQQKQFYHTEKSFTMDSTSPLSSFSPSPSLSSRIIHQPPVSSPLLSRPSTIHHTATHPLPSVDVALELQLLKQQFLVFKESAERNSQVLNLLLK